MRIILHSPSGEGTVEVSEDRVEYMKSKGWTESKSSKSVTKKQTKKSEEK
jgi:hypothetical protein|tara:strand:- start:2357 stop:2506 length:150 start_codon:yes stop_codon:yes gene_type:complete